MKARKLIALTLLAILLLSTFACRGDVEQKAGGRKSLGPLMRDSPNCRECRLENKNGSPSRIRTYNLAVAASEGSQTDMPDLPPPHESAMNFDYLPA